jgi:iron complex outermembrane receptor protein
MKSVKPLWLGVAALSVVLPGVASAQDRKGDSAALEEVVVTANRREQSLQDVPLSVTAFSSEKIRDLRIVSTVDIAQFTPGLTFAATAGEGQKTNVVMRGVGTATASETLEGNVGMYMDDVYISSTSGLTSDLYDVDRVEVLRGPQGTLYGNTVTGGLIHYISRLPSQQFSGYTNLEFGNYGQARLEAALGGGVSETLSVRLSGIWNQYDAYIDNTIGTDRNAAKAGGARLQALWTPSESVSILLRGRYSENNPNKGPSFKPRVAYLNPATGLGEPLPATLNFFGTCAGCDAAGNPNSISGGDLWTISANQPGDLEVRRTGYGVKADFKIGSMSLTSITDWETVDKFYLEDSDAAPLKTVDQFSDTSADQFQQEFRLSGSTDSLVWNLGAFYLERDVTSLFAVNFLGSNGMFPGWRSDGDTTRESENKSAYGQVEWSFSGNWSAVAGLRYYDESSDDAIVNSRLFANGTRTVVSTPTASSSFSNWSGKVGLEYRPRAGTLFYGTYSKGVRPGAFQNPGVVPAGVSPLVKEEQLGALEVGLKTDFDGAPVRLNAAAYYYDYKDMQTRAFLGTQSFTFNKDAKVKGIDLELQAKPTDALDLFLTLGWLDGKVPDMPFRGLTGVRDTELPNAPEITASAQGRYTWTLGSGAEVFSLLSASHRSDTYSEVENNPVQRVPSYTLVNARAGYRAPGGRWEAGAYVNNVFEEEYFTFVGFVTSIGIAQQFPGRPRWMGVYVNVNFD